MTSNQLSSFYSSFVAPKLSGKQRIDLLKAIESITSDHFAEFFKAELATFPSDRLNTVLQCALKNNFEGVELFSEEFYKIVEISSKRQELTRQSIKYALLDASINHGFSSFESTLIRHSADISSKYDPFYIEWCKAVQNKDLVPRITKANEEGTLDKAFYNQYTIIQSREDQTLYHLAYAEYFSTTIPPILAAFDELYRELKEVVEKNPSSTNEEKRYVDYILQYRTALAETNKDMLEEQWKKLDYIWMDIKHHIQIVHDIEYGYGDPLRTKVTPDFSLRFVDETFAKGNEKIEEIKEKVMVPYFAQRQGQLAKKGLFALQNSFAAIYYIPFQSGISIHFRFSGQSIPNRSEVKNDKGVKIYFDPISTGSRQEQTKRLVEKVFSDPSLANYLDALDTIVYHVAAHEFGHAIYGLDHVKDIIKVETKTLLEEPRAELTALHTMLLLFKQKLITENELNKYVASFALQDLRRFAMFDNPGLRPYTINAINCYKTYNKHNYVTINGDQLTLNQSKTVEVLEDLSHTFEQILKAEDEDDGQTLEKVLIDFQVETEISKWLVEKLHKK